MKNLRLAKSLLIFGIALSSLGFTGVANANAIKSDNIIEITKAVQSQTTESLVAEAPEAVIAAKAEINACIVAEDKKNFIINAKLYGDMAGTDGKFYLFELKSYEKSIGDRKDYLQSFLPGEVIEKYALNRNSLSDRLYSRFVMAVYNGEKYIQVGNARYITNPELVAKNTKEFLTPITKKGLNIEIDMLDDALELGAKHVATNIAFHQILGTGIDYEYDGKTYHFSKEAIERYDKTISALSGKSMTVTAIILNGYNQAEPDLFHPGTKKQKNVFYYMFNTQTKEGFEKTRAIAAFLAERYDGSNSKYGKISNWIIGNEINNQQWNYIGERTVEEYLDSYEKAFRVFYTAIKSTSANDRVYYSLDYNWNNQAEMDGKLKYGGKQVVDTFNTFIMQKGDIDWGLAYHPYPAPMIEPEFWDDNKTGLFTNNFESPVINFYNLNKLTDYFAREQLKTIKGHVRHIILTEQGFTATSHSRGDVSDIQAAAYAYSYYIVDSNPYIDAYILSRQVDAPLEVKQGLSFGLWKCDMSKPNLIVPTTRRKIWQVFKNIDKKNSTLETTDFAKEIIGIKKWSDVIPNFKWRAQEK